MPSTIYMWSLVPFFLRSALALPHNRSVIHKFLSTRSPDFEWTAWGDSYASGVGAGNYIDGRRCLRYEEAYPVWIEDDPDDLLDGEGGKFNNVVCSGAKAEEVIEYQFYETAPGSGQPNWQFWPRPAVGKPTMGTLTVGGDDIDFPGILNNCIVDGFPWPLSQGFTPRTCDEQRALTWSLIADDDSHTEPNHGLIQKIADVIEKILELGNEQSSQFFVYVTGYGQFFNEQTTACNDVTFARKANPHDDGQEHTRLSTELRADFNAMSRMLNEAIKKACSLADPQKARYVDIDAMLEGHRFCEDGVNEPDQENPNTFFFHYPYGADDDNDAAIQYLNEVHESSVSSLEWNPATTLWSDYLSAFYDQLDEDGLANALGGDADAAYDIWPDTIGYRAKLFHPTMAFHEQIYKQIVEQYLRDVHVDNVEPELNKAVSIIMEQDDEGFFWNFYETDKGQAAGCNTDYQSVFKGPYFDDADIDDPPLPSGAYEFTIWGRDCKWSGNGENLGLLVCGEDRYSCEAPSDPQTNDCENGTQQHEGAYCDFDSDGEATEPEPEEEEITCMLFEDLESVCSPFWQCTNEDDSFNEFYDPSASLSSTMTAQPTYVPIESPAPCNS